jgi:hypothetical protein
MNIFLIGELGMKRKGYDLNLNSGLRKHRPADPLVSTFRFEFNLCVHKADLTRQAEQEMTISDLVFSCCFSLSAHKDIKLKDAFFFLGRKQPHCDEKDCLLQGVYMVRPRPPQGEPTIPSILVLVYLVLPGESFPRIWRAQISWLQISRF